MRRVLMLLPVLALALARVAPAGDPQVLDLTLDDAVARALTNSPDIAVERLSNESARLALDELRRSYEPLFNSKFQAGSKFEPARDAFSGGAEVNTDSAAWDFGLEQPLQTGGLVRLDLLNTRMGTDSVYSTFNPGYTANLQVSVAQPLLRNRAIDERRQRIRVAKKNSRISDLVFRERVQNLMAEVKQRYFDLLLARDVLAAYQHVLDLTNKLQDANRERVKGGILSRSDLLLGDAELAARRSDLLSAKASLARIEDSLKRLILPEGDAAGWNVNLKPTDQPSPDAVVVDVEAALRRALAERTDVQAARVSLERSEVLRSFARDQTLPAIDLRASYGALGMGGTQLVRSEMGGPVAQEIPGGYGDAVSDALARRYPTWVVALNVSYPILTRSARVSLARARVGRNQAETIVKQVERDVIAEVREAARSVETNYARYAQASLAYQAGQERFDAEMARLQSGMSSPFFVVQAQRDSTVAQLSMLNALADYRKSLVLFERVQAAGLSSDGFLAQ